MVHNIRKAKSHRVIQGEEQSGVVHPSPGRSKPHLVYLVQYVPSLAGNDSITIGLLIYDPEKRVLASKFNLDIEAIKRAHPSADEEFLTELAEDFSYRIGLHRADPERFLIEAESYSNLIQVTRLVICGFSSLEEAKRLLENSH